MEGKASFTPTKRGRGINYKVLAMTYMLKRGEGGQNVLM